MDDDALLAGILRRLLTDDADRYHGFAAMVAPGLFCMDGSVDVNAEEEAAIRRVEATVPTI